MTATDRPSTPAFTSIRRRRLTAAPFRAGLFWCVISIMTLTIVGPYLSYRPPPATGEGSPFRQVMYILTFAFAIYSARVLQEPRRFLVAVPFSLVIALAWCWISLGWALNPDIAVRRLFLTTMLIWTIFLVVGNASYRSTLLGVRSALAILMVINYAVVFAMPQAGIHQLNQFTDANLVGSWRGIMLSKNFAGATCAFTVMFFLLDARRVPIFLRAIVLLGTAFFLYHTNSKTSMGILAIALAAAWLYKRYNPAYRGLMIPLVMILGVVLFMLSQIYWAELEEPFSTPEGFTGRVQIWPLLLAYAQDHWLLGAGYGSFWNIGLGAGPIFTYGKGWVTDLGNGHNGYLDLLVTIGAPGLILVIVATIIWPLARLFASSTANRSGGALLIAMIVFCVGHNMTESSLMDRDAIVQVFLMLAIALIGPVTASSTGKAGIRNPEVARG